MGDLKTWILILVLASVQVFLQQPHRHGPGVEEKACVACQAARATIADTPSSPLVILPQLEWLSVEQWHVPAVSLLSPVLERGNPRSPPSLSSVA